MGKPSATVNSKNTPLKKGYPTLNGVYGEKIKKGYITRNGVWELIYSGDLEFTYKNGNALVAGDLSGQWEIALLSSGKLSFSSLNTDSVDVWAISAGSNGKRGSYDFSDAINRGGSGGDGGRVRFVANIPVKEGTEYNVSIGQPNSSQGADGGDTMGLGISTSGGAFKPGGVNPGRDGNRNGQPGVLAFNGEDSLNFPGRKFGASGAAGGSYDQKNYRAYAPGTGGETGAGNGGAAYYSGAGGGTNAEINTGSGGGNGGIGDGDGQFGKGSNGVMLIRPRIK